MAITFVNQATATMVSATSLAVVGTAPLNGNTLFAFISIANGSVTGIAQNSGTVNWQLLKKFGTCELWVGGDIKNAGTTATVTTSILTAMSVNVCQFKGFCGTPVIDKFATASGVGATATTGTTALTTNASELWLSVIAVLSGSGFAVVGTPTNGYTALTSAHDTSNTAIGGGYFVPTTTGTARNGWTLTTDPGYTWDTISVAIMNPPPVLQQVGATVSGASIAVAVTSTIAGSFLTMVVGAPSGFTVSSVADNKGNTWVQRQTLTNTTTGYFYDCINAIGGVTTVTVTFSGSTFPAVIFREYDGALLGTIVIDPSVGVTALGTSTAAASGNTPVTAFPSEIIFGWAAASTAVVESAGTGYGFFAYQTSASLSIGLEHLQVSVVGVQSAALTLTSSHAWVCGCALYGLVVPSGSMPMSIYPAFTLVTL